MNIITTGSTINILNTLIIVVLITVLFLIIKTLSELK